MRYLTPTNWHQWCQSICQSLSTWIITYLEPACNFNNILGPISTHNATLAVTCQSKWFPVHKHVCYPRFSRYGYIFLKIYFNTLSFLQKQIYSESFIKYFYHQLNIQYFSKPGDTFLSGRRLVLPRLAWPRLALPCLVMPCLVLPGFECDAFLSNIKKWDLYGDVVLMHLLLHLQSD